MSFNRTRELVAIFRKVQQPHPAVQGAFEAAIRKTAAYPAEEDFFDTLGVDPQPVGTPGRPRVVRIETVPGTTPSEATQAGEDTAAKE